MHITHRLAHLASLWLGIASASVPAQAANYYVAVGGSGDGSAQSPWGSLDSAVGSSSPVRAGDVITVAAGTYTIAAAVSFRKSGAPGQPITLKGEPGAILDVTASSTPGGALDLSGLHHWMIDGFPEGRRERGAGEAARTFGTATRGNGTEKRGPGVPTPDRSPASPPAWLQGERH